MNNLVWTWTMIRSNENETKSTNKKRKKEGNSKFLRDKSNKINEAIFACPQSYVRTSRSRYQSPSPQVVIRPLGVRSFVHPALFTARIKIENELWPPVPDTIRTRKRTLPFYLSFLLSISLALLFEFFVIFLRRVGKKNRNFCYFCDLEISKYKRIDYYWRILKIWKFSWNSE